VTHFGNTPQETWDAGEVAPALSGRHPNDQAIYLDAATVYESPKALDDLCLGAGQAADSREVAASVLGL